MLPEVGPAEQETRQINFRWYMAIPKVSSTRRTNSTDERQDEPWQNMYCMYDIGY